MPIIKDYRTPFGRFEPDVRDFGAITMLKPIGGATLPMGETWLTLNARHRAPEPRPRPKPVTYTVPCRGPRCQVVFETANPRRIYHSKSCLHAASRSQRPSRAQGRVRVVTAPECGHPDRPMIARGKCRPCYNAWHRRQKGA